MTDSGLTRRREPAAVTDHRLITSEAMFKALAAAGVVDGADSYRRIVIDLQQGHAVVVYGERYGDERLLKVTQTLEGVEISGVPAD